MKCIISFLVIFATLAVSVQSLKFIQLQSSQSLSFVTVYWPDGNVKVDSVPYTHASTFELHTTAIENQWQLRAMKNNMYLVAANGGGGEVTATSASASGWETYEAITVTSTEVKLKSFDGTYLTMDASSNLQSTASTVADAAIFTVVDIPQQRGVNLGSWFVPEKWMFSEDSTLWSGTNATDLYTLCTSLGEAEATRRLQAHWGSWFVESDFQRMAANGVNHVRIPIGYWDVLPSSPPYVYGAVDTIDQAVQWAAAHGITVLIDLHGAPGSQNGQDHSGHAGEINWPEPENVALTVEVLGMMAERWANNSNVWGFELLNEPHYSLSHELLTSFYREAYTAIRQYSTDTHVVINSLYGPHDWTATVLPEPEYRNAILDLHLYTVWSGFTEPEQYYTAGQQFGEEVRAMTPYYPVIVGEMSLATALEPYSHEQRQQFADSEMSAFVANAYGYFFWSEKLDYASEDWALQDAIKYVQEYYVEADQ